MVGTQGGLETPVSPVSPGSERPFSPQHRLSEPLPSFVSHSDMSQENANGSHDSLEPPGSPYSKRRSAPEGQQLPRSPYSQRRYELPQMTNKIRDNRPSSLHLPRNSPNDDKNLTRSPTTNRKFPNQPGPVTAPKPKKRNPRPPVMRPGKRPSGPGNNSTTL